MTRFNAKSAARVGRRGPTSPITTTGVTGTTHEGAPGHGRDVKSELFLLGVSAMVAEDAFYEKARERAERFRRLVVEAAAQDPEWTVAFLTWLRGEGNVRSAPLVAAAELVRARPSGMRTRAVVDAVLQRADEPAEILAYWLTTYGKPIPIALKRGVADAVVRLYTERSLAKYDPVDRAVRMGDVVDLVTPAHHHPEVRGTWRSSLYRHALDRRHERGGPVPEDLPLLRARAELLALPVAERRAVLLSADGPARLQAAGITWEALAGWLQGPMDARAWEAVIPGMGVMALARNLRNFDEAGVGDEAAEAVARRFTDPVTIARSRMFPFRWFQAYAAAPSAGWGHALETALGLATQNVPRFPGRTLVLVDTSSSMETRLSGRSQMTHAQAAALFGVVLTLRGADVDLHGFADGTFPHRVAPGGAVLAEVAAFVRRIGEVGHGTRIAEAVSGTYRGHDRVVILSDMQTFHGRRSVTEAAPARIPMYAFNLAGHRHGAIPTGSGTRHELGGLTDAAFRMIPLLESARSATWPWLPTTHAP
ncbi:TROVE domain-containing protein [Actinocorallia herbida]|uniref:TROVE domain-containing protein n=1 Tax=Actinocorallia herbida TaxID=58109 RepID=A0A3N1CVS5_9ACTN|nr:TROVE domain-containing protein [Actinocorallia herbida]ROO85345.1 TROVE domain-containing protein [Actinocorallia herbida]